jgi:hypothetical protein
MMKVRLDLGELAYLRRRALLPSEVLDQASPTGGGFLLNLSESDADNVRDACGEDLQRIGFDENYKPTKEGALLEGLIDKLLVR